MRSGVIVCLCLWICFGLSFAGLCLWDCVCVLTCGFLGFLMRWLSGRFGMLYSMCAGLYRLGLLCWSVGWWFLCLRLLRFGLFRFGLVLSCVGVLVWFVIIVLVLWCSLVGLGFVVFEFWCLSICLNLAG